MFLMLTVSAFVDVKACCNATGAWHSTLGFFPHSRWPLLGSVQAILYGIGLCPASYASDLGKKTSRWAASSWRLRHDPERLRLERAHLHSDAGEALLLRSNRCTSARPTTTTWASPAVPRHGCAGSGARLRRLVDPRPGAAVGGHAGHLQSADQGHCLRGRVSVADLLRDTLRRAWTRNLSTCQGRSQARVRFRPRDVWPHTSTLHRGGKSIETIRNRTKTGGERVSRLLRRLKWGHLCRLRMGDREWTRVVAPPAP